MLWVESSVPWSSQLVAFAVACITRGGKLQRRESRRKKRKNLLRREVKTQEEIMMKEGESLLIQIPTRMKKCLIWKKFQEPVDPSKSLVVSCWTRSLRKLIHNFISRKNSDPRGNHEACLADAYDVSLPD